jgi:hypothetical protein
MTNATCRRLILIIHCTQKLAKKLDPVSREPLAVTGPLGSWHANLYTIDHRQCVLFCHDRTRFVLFIPGLKKKDFHNLDFWFNDVFANTLMKCRYETRLIEKAMSCVDDLQFDTVCDRSVLGTLRTVRLMDLDGILWQFDNVMDLPMYSVSARLNERPVKTKGMKQSECLWPVKAMKDLIASL